MHRPDHSTADPNGIASGVAGYTEGDPLVPVPRTIATAAQFNDPVEGLCRYVEHSGLTLSKGDYDQIREALERKRFWDAVNDYRIVDSGLSIAGGIGHANGWFFASEASGALNKSKTGEVWETAGTAGAGTSNDFAYVSGSGYVAVGAAIYFDADASGSWTLATTSPSSTLNAVAEDGTTLCAVGDSGVIYTSTDGDNWTSRTAAGSYAGNFECIIWSADLSLFIAGGTTGEIQTSADGITWAQRKTGGGTIANIVEGDNGQLFACATTSGSFYSTNGTSWTSGGPVFTHAAGYAGGFVGFSSADLSVSRTGGATATWDIDYDTLHASLSGTDVAIGNGRMIYRNGNDVFWWRRADPTPDLV